jgi:hypothetical protein
MTLQIVGIVSAVGIVGAFAAMQFDLVRPHDLSYLGARSRTAAPTTPGAD